MSTVLVNSPNYTRFASTTRTSYRICERCVMDTSDSLIEFDKQGICNHCRQFAERASKEIPVGSEREERLEKFVSRIKHAGRRREYDCLIGVSGGVDSTVVAYHVKRLGLRSLALHLDNGWNSELAVDNIKKTLHRLNIDLQTHVIDWSEFRDVQLSFLKASVPNCEIPTDHAINALLINTALKMRIRYILHGGNLATEGIMPKAWGYYNLDLKHLRAIQKRFGSKRLSTLPQLSLRRFVYAVTVRGIRYVPILNYLNYNKSEAKRLIREDLDWRDYGGKHYESIYTRFYQGYILPEKFGYDKRRAHLSSLICSGELSRQQALEEMEQERYPEDLLRQDRRFVLKKLGLSDVEFDNIMQQPVRKHEEYSSNQFFFEKMDTLKTALKRLATRV